MVDHVLILVAMEAEAAPFISASKLEPGPAIDACGAQCYSGVHSSGVKITLAVNGKCKSGVDNVGTTPAAITAFACISALRPSLVLNAGTAGGFGAKGAKIGDAFLSTTLRHHDRRIPIPGWDDYAKGHHSSLDASRLVKELNFKTGIVTTGNSLDYTPRDMELMLENDATVKDMEAAAIAWVCEKLDCPFLALKVVTDIVDGDRPSHEEFMENLGAAAHALHEALPKTIQFIAGKSIAELSK
jgi:5'-methylthioadenosine nucleosidase